MTFYKFVLRNFTQISQKSDSYLTCAREIIKLKDRIDLSLLVTHIKEKLVACKYKIENLYFSYSQKAFFI